MKTRDTYLQYDINGVITAQVTCEKAPDHPHQSKLNQKIKTHEHHDKRVVNGELVKLTRDGVGDIIDVLNFIPIPLPLKVETNADTVSDTITDTVTDTITDTVTDTITDTITDTVTDTIADTITDTVTDTIADTITDIISDILNLGG